MPDGSKQLVIYKDSVFVSAVELPLEFLLKIFACCNQIITMNTETKLCVGKQLILIVILTNKFFFTGLKIFFSQFMEH